MQNSTTAWANRQMKTTAIIQIFTSPQRKVHGIKLRNLILICQCANSSWREGLWRVKLNTPVWLPGKNGHTVAQSCASNCTLLHASNCMGCPNFRCEFVRPLAIVHLHLQLCFTLPVMSTRFCYFAHMILLHHRIFCHFVHEYPCFSLRLPLFKLPLFGLCMVT